MSHFFPRAYLAPIGFQRDRWRRSSRGFERLWDDHRRWERSGQAVPEYAIGRGARHRQSDRVFGLKYSSGVYMITVFSFRARRKHRSIGIHRRWRQRHGRSRYMTVSRFGVKCSPPHRIAYTQKVVVSDTGGHHLPELCNDGYLAEALGRRHWMYAGCLVTGYAVIPCIRRPSTLVYIVQVLSLMFLNVSRLTLFLTMHLDWMFSINMVRGNTRQEGRDLLTPLQFGWS